MCYTMSLLMTNVKNYIYIYDISIQKKARHTVSGLLVARAGLEPATFGL